MSRPTTPTRAPTPTRNPPSAAFASLCLGGALAPGFALRARGFRACLTGGCWGMVLCESPYIGARKNALGVVGGVRSANRQDSNHLRLARRSRGGLRGPTSPVLPTTFASRPVRRNPNSCSAAARSADEHTWRRAYSNCFRSASGVVSFSGLVLSATKRAGV